MPIGFHKGLILSDLNCFDTIIRPENDNTLKLNSNNFKNYIIRKNWYKRRLAILNLLKITNNLKTGPEFDYYRKITKNQIYDNTGLFLFSTSSLFYLKIFERGIEELFLTQKIKFWINEKIKNHTHKKLIFVVERIDFLSKSLQKKLKNFIFRDKDDISWIFIGKKTKKIKFKTKKFDILFTKNYRRYLKDINFSKNSNKNKLIVKKSNKLFKKTLVSTSKISTFKVEILNPKFQIFMNILFFRFFFKDKTLKLEYLDYFVRNSVKIGSNFIHFKYFIKTKIQRNLVSLFKKSQKKTYIFLIFSILTSIQD